MLIERGAVVSKLSKRVSDILTGIFSFKEIPFDPDRRKVLQDFAGVAVVSFLAFIGMQKEKVLAQIPASSDFEKRALEDLIRSIEQAELYGQKIKDRFGINVEVLFDKITVIAEGGDKYHVQGANPKQFAESVKKIYLDLLIYPPNTLTPNLNNYVDLICLGQVVEHEKKDNVKRQIGGFATWDKRIYLQIGGRERPRTLHHETGHMLDFGLDEAMWIKKVNDVLNEQDPKFVFEPKYTPENDNPILDSKGKPTVAKPVGFMDAYGTKTWREDFATIYEICTSPQDDFSLHPEKDLQTKDRTIILAKIIVVKEMLLQKLGFDEDYFKFLVQAGLHKNDEAKWVKAWEDFWSK